MTDEQQPMLEVYLQEYSKLKDEQIQRLHFRDNLLYFTLAAFGTVLAFAIGDQVNSYALLVLPWVSLVLGWTYLVNDQKITAIGRYIRYVLVENVSGLVGRAGADTRAMESIFGWEIAHRSDPWRRRRKIEQLIIDEVAFVASGLVALITFLILMSGKSIHPAAQLLGWVEFIFLVILSVEIFINADLAQGR